MMVRREKLWPLRTKGSPIADSHIERAGSLRVFVGGGAMYFCIPMFAALRGGIFAIDRIVAPAIGLRFTPVASFIVLDRHAIAGLSWFDAFNCDYCAYANGIEVMLDDRLDQLADAEGPLSSMRKLLVGAVATTTAAVMWPFQTTFLGLFYGVLISRPLGYSRLSAAEADQRMERAGYADRLPRLARWLLRRQKRFALQLGAALEQIESAWCPLKHVKPGIYPEHHSNFFEPHELEAMRQTLRTVGTVYDD
jgi:hypothetical protein